MKPHSLYSDAEWPEKDIFVGTVHPASDASVQLVLAQPVDQADGNGRSPWVWLRTADGTLILGVFPQGETYLAVEQDAYYPGDAE